MNNKYLLIHDNYAYFYMYKDRVVVAMKDGSDPFIIWQADGHLMKDLRGGKKPPMQVRDILKKKEGAEKSASRKLMKSMTKTFPGITDADIEKKTIKTDYPTPREIREHYKLGSGIEATKCLSKLGKLHNYENTNFEKIRCHFIKFDIYFLGLPQEIFFCVITDN